MGRHGPGSDVAVLDIAVLDVAVVGVGHRARVRWYRPCLRQETLNEASSAVNA
jgi:hypothetical protein